MKDKISCASKSELPEKASLHVTLSQYLFSGDTQTAVLKNSGSELSEDAIKQQVELIEPTSLMTKISAAKHRAIQLYHLRQFSVFRQMPTLDHDNGPDDENNSETSESNPLGFNPLMKSIINHLARAVTAF